MNQINFLDERKQMKFIVFVSAGLFLCSLTATGGILPPELSAGEAFNPVAEKAKNIFSPDEREAITSGQYPWSAIGYLSNGCTGTLVSKNLVLTAAHCVVENGEINYQISFKPNMIGGNSPHTVYPVSIWVGSLDPAGSRHSDWALIRISEDLGDIYGWYGINVTSRNNFPYYWLNYGGYSADWPFGWGTGSAQLNCTARAVNHNNQGLLYHDCDSTRGSSGSAIFNYEDNGAYVIAVVVAEYRQGGDDSLVLDGYSHDFANIAIFTSEMLETFHRVHES